MELREAVPYVAAAYLVVLAAIILYVLLIGQKLGRIERELDQVEAELRATDRDEVPAP